MNSEKMTYEEIKYVIGEHELSMEKVTYHIGFSRKPGWLEEDSGSIN